MSTDESLEKEIEFGLESVALDAIAWGRKFVFSLESEFTNGAAVLMTDATAPVYRRIMFQAFITMLTETGASPSEILQLLQENARVEANVQQNAGWSNELNARRIALIDRLIQQKLSTDESLELQQLTERLRRNVESESLIQLDGARQLHRRLLETELPESPR